MEHGILHDAVVFLAAALLAVPLFQRLGLGSIVGYLTAGILIGPHALQLISSSEDVLHFAEFGVVMLLFLIGLELNPRRLWELRMPILGTGGVQVIATASAIAGLGVLSGYPLPASILAGMGLSLSSTAIAVQLMRERGQLLTPAGQTSFSVLLFQDLAVIPMLAVLPLLSDATTQAQDGGAWLQTLKALGAVLLVIVGGRYVLRPVFRLIASTNLREVFTAFSLFLIVAIAALMQAAGLSMALGTFLAGVLLADSEYRHELEIDLEPFKGLLMGLFFIAVGMSVNLELLVSHAAQVAGLVFAFVMIKIGLLQAIGRFSGLDRTAARSFSFTLSQGGEFAFVLFSLGTQLGVVDMRTSGVLVLAVALSMLFTPILMLLNDRFIESRFASRAKDSRPFDTPEDEGSPILIAGYGRMGQIVGRLLQTRGFGVTVLDHDPNQIDLLRKFDVKVIYGDATRLDLLRAAGAGHAKLLVVAIDDMEAAYRVVEMAREHFPNLKILARVRNRPEAYKFMKKEVEVFRETFGTALEMAEAALKDLGYSAHEARRLVLKFSRHDRAMLREGAKQSDDEANLITLARRSREELTKLMSAEEDRRDAPSHDGWG